MAQAKKQQSAKERKRKKCAKDKYVLTGARLPGAFETQTQLGLRHARANYITFTKWSRLGHAHELLLAKFSAIRHSEKEPNLSVRSTICSYARRLASVNSFARSLDIRTLIQKIMPVQVDTDCWKLAKWGIRSSKRICSDSFYKHKRNKPEFLWVFPSRKQLLNSDFQTGFAVFL